MAILAFDCCLTSISAAVLTDNGLTELAEGAEAGGQAERLMPMIDATLAKAGVAYADLSRLAVTLGPGGFTSVRVGIAAARGLALALSIPVVGQSSLQALAAAVVADGVPLSAKRLVTVVPGGRAGIYWQTFDGAGAPLDQARLVSLDEVPNLGIDRADVVAGPGATIALAAAKIAPDAVHARPNSRPSAAILAKMAKHLTPTSELRPIYLRPADARPQIGKALERA